MENIEIFDDIKIVLQLLKQGCIMLAYDGKSKIFFAQKKEKIYCQSNNCSFLLSYLEFTNLYKNCKFIIYNPQEHQEIDLKKDEEYYSYDVLKY